MNHSAALKTVSNQVIALAATYQVCDMVSNIAWKGKCNTANLQTAINSIFITNPASIDDIFNNATTSLNDGLKLLVGSLNPQAQDLLSHNYPEITKYALMLLALENKLHKKPERLANISQGILAAQTQYEHYGAEHNNTLAALADIYQQHISILTPQIMVNGERLYLSDNSNAAKIRTLLLAGIRAAVLWRQCGGSRWLFMLNRKAYLCEANSLLAI